MDEFHASGGTLYAGININPVEGLKLCLPDGWRDGCQAGININPVEGLKQHSETFYFWSHDAGININPVEGLKLDVLYTNYKLLSGRNQHQPSRGIKTGRCHIAHWDSRKPESTSTQSRD